MLNEAGDYSMRERLLISGVGLPSNEPHEHMNTTQKHDDSLSGASYFRLLTISFMSNSVLLFYLMAQSRT